MFCLCIMSFSIYILRVDNCAVVCLTLLYNMLCFVFVFFKSGPYFKEFLSWTVTEDCELIMKCKVRLQN